MHKAEGIKEEVYLQSDSFQFMVKKNIFCGRFMEYTLPLSLPLPSLQGNRIHFYFWKIIKKKKVNERVSY